MNARKTLSLIWSVAAKAARIAKTGGDYEFSNPKIIISCNLKTEIHIICVYVCDLELDREGKGCLNVAQLVFVLSLSSPVKCIIRI